MEKLHQPFHTLVFCLFFVLGISDTKKWTAFNSINIEFMFWIESNLDL